MQLYRLSNGRKGRGKLRNLSAFQSIKCIPVAFGKILDVRNKCGLINKIVWKSSKM